MGWTEPDDVVGCVMVQPGSQVVCIVNRQLGLNGAHLGEAAAPSDMGDLEEVS